MKECACVWENAGSLTKSPRCAQTSLNLSPVLDWAGSPSENRAGPQRSKGEHAWAAISQGKNRRRCWLCLPGSSFPNVPVRLAVPN